MCPCAWIQVPFSFLKKQNKQTKTFKTFKEFLYWCLFISHITEFYKDTFFQVYHQFLKQLGNLLHEGREAELT